MITNLNGRPATLNCWSCGSTMKAFADDMYYTYYGCAGCGQERLQPKDVYPGMIEDRIDGTMG